MTVMPTPDSTQIHFPYSYSPVEPLDAGNAAYAAYFASGCAYGAFAGVVSSVVAAGNDAELARFPLAVSTYGKGGLAGARSLCGAINGGAMAISMFHGTENAEDEDSKLRDSLIQQLSEWYKTAELPVFTPETAVIESAGGLHMDVPTVAAGSLLCEESCSVWEQATGHERDSRERKERCARLTADVAVKVVELLNSVE